MLRANGDTHATFSENFQYTESIDHAQFFKSPCNKKTRRKETRPIKSNVETKFMNFRYDVLWDRVARL